MPPRNQNPNCPGAAPRDKGWLHYVEPYFGGGAVLLANDPEGISEVVNDLHVLLENFWCVLKDPKLFPKFQRKVEATAFSKTAYDASVTYCKIMQFPIGETDYVEFALRFFVACRQSLSGRMSGFASITRNRTRRGMNEQVSAWLNCIEGLPEVHERMKRVLILNGEALDVIRKEDGPHTLFYLDPPYLHETRATTGEYEHEMSYKQHEELLKALSKIEGRFLLSGYPSNLYDCYRNLNGWKQYEKAINNHAAGGKTKRKMVECVWTNY